MAKSTQQVPLEEHLAALKELVKTQRELIKTQRRLVDTATRLNESDADSLRYSRAHNDFLMNSIADLIFTSEGKSRPQASQEEIEEAVRLRMGRVFEALQRDISEGKSDCHDVQELFHRVFPPLYSDQIAALRPAEGLLPPNRQAAFDLLTQPEGADKKLILYFMDLIADAPTNKEMYEQGLLPMVLDERTKSDLLMRKDLTEALSLLRQGKPGSYPSTMDNYVSSARLAKKAQES